MSLWLEMITRDSALQAPDDPARKVRVALFWGLATSYRTIQAAKTRICLSGQECGVLGTARKSMVLSMDWLHKHSLLPGNMPGYQLIPKVHLCDHMWRRCIRTTANPARLWTFGAEDAMERFARLSHACRGASASRRTIVRWCSFFLECSGMSPRCQCLEFELKYSAEGRMPSQVRFTPL